MKAYWDSLTKEQQGELAGKVGSTPGYLRLVFNGYKKASFVLAKKLEQCTSGAITKSDLTAMRRMFISLTLRSFRQRHFLNCQILTRQNLTHQNLTRQNLMRRNLAKKRVFTRQNLAGIRQ